MQRQTTVIQLPSAPMQTIYTTIQDIGTSNIPVFITGETGVGKESIARYIHESGPRRDQPFMAINCGRFSAELLQSERFGHEAEAFTSTIRQWRAAFEMADGGILFLNEVPEMSLDAQKMLLRVLDTLTFTRLGGNEDLTVNVHIIAATNKDIVKVVAEKEFKENLYYRLKGVRLHLPPLRKRPEDIAPLVESFVSEFSAEYRKDVKGITPEALRRLEQAAWPGNIRQLRNTVKTAIALATTDRLETQDFLGIYLELAESLIPIWHTLPSETQNAIWETLPLETQHIVKHKLTNQTSETWLNPHVSNTSKIIEESELLSKKNMNLKQILHAVAQDRIEIYKNLREAAESLNIDTRTLQKYAQWKESDD